MLSLSAKIRSVAGKRTKVLRKKGVLPAVLYGPGIKNVSLEIDLKIFEKLYKQAGESSLINLEIENQKQKSPVLIHKTEKDPLSGQFIHADFYQPSLKKEMEADVMLVFEGVSSAVKDLGGTLLKNIQQVKVRSLPQNLPHEIKIGIENLKNFNDSILVKDLKAPEGVKILRNPNDIVASVVAPEKVEEELEKPIEEKVEDVAKVEKKKKAGEEAEAETPAPAAETKTKDKPKDKTKDK